MIKKKARVLKDECVACGCCKKLCKREAIFINKGIYAKVIENLCVGCGQCMRICPANVIEMVEVEV